MNALALFGGEGISRSATFLVAVIVARRFGAAALGQYGFALAVASIFAILPDFGLQLLATRELASRSGELRDIFGGLHWLKFFLVCAVAASAVLFGQELIHDRVRRGLLYVLVARALFQSFSQIYMSILKAYERMHFIAVQQLVGAAVAVAGAAAALALRASLFALIGCLLVGQAIETWVGWQIVSWRFSPGKIYRWDSALQWRILSASTPIGLTVALQALNLRLDVLALGINANNLELGRFQAAAWFLVGTFLSVSLLMNVIFPKLSRLLQNPTERSRAYVESLLKNGSLLSMSGSFVVWVVAPWILRWVYGPSFTTAVVLLRTLALALPFMFLNTMLSYVFIAARLRSVYLGTLAWGVALGSFLAVVFALRYGATGVAVADVIREFAMTCAFLFHLKRKRVARQLGGDLLKAYLGVAGLALACSIVVQAVRPVAEWRAVFELFMLGGTLLVVGLPRRTELALLVDETS